MSLETKIDAISAKLLPVLVEEAVRWTQENFKRCYIVLSGASFRLSAFQSIHGQQKSLLAITGLQKMKKIKWLKVNNSNGLSNK